MFQDQLLRKIDQLVRGQLILDDYVQKMAKIKKENPLDERVVQLDARWKQDPDFDDLLIRLASPMDPPPPLSSVETPQISDDGTKFSWDLDPRYKFIPSEFTLKKEEDYGSTTYLQWFMVDSSLVELKYRDYYGGYLHGDDLWVQVHPRMPTGLDALLLL